jgi:Skp family chaperone for outer membrane proteins
MRRSAGAPVSAFSTLIEAMQKLKRISLPLIALVLAAFSCAHAQANGTAKIAVIYSEAFQDPKVGITRYRALISKVDAEFQPIQNELNQTAQRLKALQDEITKMQQGTTPATPAQVQAKIDQFDQQKKDYQRKGEDAQTNYQKRRAEVLQPLQEDVAKALDVFAKARGITILLDGSQILITYADDAIDITNAFIADYNSKNPATAAGTPR